MEKGNVWISFFHIEEFFNHLTSSIIIQVYGLFGYPWHVIDINKIKFTPNMNYVFTKTADWIFYRSSCYVWHFSFSLDNMHL